MTVRDFFDVFDYDAEPDGFHVDFGEVGGFILILPKDKALVDAFGDVVVERFVHDEHGTLILYAKTENKATLVKREVSA